MITCRINGREAIPVLRESIKITRENPFISEKDSYTMDITFPLDIPQNLKVFGHIGRIGVSKRVVKYDDCQLYTGNSLLIRGVGTVTHMTRDEVKLQIIGGNSAVKYRSRFSDAFIDHMQYMEVDAKYRLKFSDFAGMSEEQFLNATDPIYNELNQQHYIGNSEKYVFMPVWDSTHDVMANQVTCLSPSGWWRDSPGILQRYIVQRRAVQPNLMMVLHTVMQSMGYAVKLNYYNIPPWNQLIICSARQTDNIAEALPHWSAAKFLEEFRLLFNASYVFDDVNMTVEICHANEALNCNEEHYEPLDEFECDYDEDGLEYIGSSNIEYNLNDDSEYPSVIPSEVIKKFPIEEYDDESSLSGMSTEEKLTKIFRLHWPDGLHYYSEELNGEGEPTGTLILKRAGVFTSLVRDRESDSAVSLNICPVAMVIKETGVQCIIYLNNYVRIATDDANRELWLPTVDSNSVMDAKISDEREYVTVEDVLDGGMDSEAENKEEETVMQLMWVTGNDPFIPTSAPWVGCCPTVFTDGRVGPQGYRRSMALDYCDMYHIGDFHKNAMTVTRGDGTAADGTASATVDGNHEECISFLSDKMPDPTKTYNFNGKLYLCAKIEASVNESGVDRLKRGYFYELL